MTAARSATLAALAQDLATAEAVRRLAEAGIDVLLLKGPTFARWLYDDGEPRGYCDADLLVAPPQHPAAVAALAGLAYRDIVDGISTFEMPPGHATTLVRRDSCGRVRGQIDLHHRLPGTTTSTEEGWGLLWGHRERFRLADARVHALDVVGRLATVALHAGHQPQPKPKLDLARALERARDDDWRRAYDLATALGGEAVFRSGLSLLPTGRDLCRRLGLATGPRMPASVPLVAGVQRMVDLPTRDRLRLLGRKLVPSPEYMRLKHVSARGSRFGLARAYLNRPVYLARHLPRAWWEVRRAG